MTHDKFCYVAINGGSCCPWMGACDCQCMCDFINEIRNDQTDQCVQIINQYIVDTHPAHARNFSCPRCDVEAALKVVRALLKGEK